MAGRADDDLVEAIGEICAEEVGLATARGGAQRVAGRSQALAVHCSRRPRTGLIALRQRRIEVGDGAHAPAGGVRPAAAGPIGPGLRRSAVFVALAERAILAGLRVGLAGDAAEVEWPVGPRRREDRPQAGELVETDLGRRLLVGQLERLPHPDVLGARGQERAALGEIAAALIQGDDVGGLPIEPSSSSFRKTACSSQKTLRSMAAWISAASRGL